MKDKKRYTVIDWLRGIAIISMVIYHATWDIVYIFGVEWEWFGSFGAHIWQRSIRWAFILLSGFCFSMGTKKLKRALEVAAGALIIFIATSLFMPDSRITLGVLCLIAAAMLVSIPADKFLKRVPPCIGFIAALTLFIFTADIHLRTLGFFDLTVATLPESMYANYFTAFFGMPHDGFFSTDYVSFFPWAFVFYMGYYLYMFFKKHGLLEYLSFVSVPPIEFLGRHSLIIYLAHQPIVYAVLFVIFKLI